MQAIGATQPPRTAAVPGGVAAAQQSVEAEKLVDDSTRSDGEHKDLSPSELDRRASRGRPMEVLLEQARKEDTAHRTAYQNRFPLTLCVFGWRLAPRQLDDLSRSFAQSSNRMTLLTKEARSTLVKRSTPRRLWLHDVGGRRTSLPGARHHLWKNR